jgi:peptidoglycan/LPS O-acetylase OafA/YrhL
VKGERLEFLDALRGIAILSVVIGHLMPINIIYLATFGVNIFFLCSGFIIPASIERKGSIKIFWIRRFWRLFPLYWFNISLWLIFIYLNHIPYSVSTIFANLTMLPALFGEKVMVNLFWTLNYEMIFYMLVTLFFMFGLLRKPVLIASIFLFLSLLLKMPFLYFMGLMFVGTAVYRLYRGELNRYAFYFVAILLVLVELRIFTADLTVLKPHLLVYPVFMAFVFLKLKNPKPLIFSGHISYSLYLNHLWVTTILSALPITYCKAVIWIISAILFSVLTYRLVERQGIRLGRMVTPEGSYADTRLSLLDISRILVTWATFR